MSGMAMGVGVTHYDVVTTGVEKKVKSRLLN